MERVIGVRFQEAGKIYYFSPEGFEDTEVGDYVVVETSRGLEVARVVVAPQQVVLAELSEPLKPITRRALAEDVERMFLLRQQAKRDVEVARRVAAERDLPMKIVNATYNLDGTRLTLFFTSEGRVDFRDLLRDLSQQLNTQVQLRQVGPRDQAKAVGGYGRCGRRLCCTSWLTNFPAISIKMAKEQNLPLNPSKISGMCGRLLCCLTYEDDTYKRLKSQLPRPGTTVSTPSGDARVLAVNALRQMVTLQMDTMQVVELPAAALAMEQGVVRIIDLPPEETEPAPPPPANRMSGQRTAPPRPPRDEARPAARGETEPSSGAGRGHGPRPEQGRAGQGPQRSVRNGQPASGRGPEGQVAPAEEREAQARGGRGREPAGQPPREREERTPVGGDGRDRGSRGAQGQAKPARPGRTPANVPAPAAASNQSAEGEPSTGGQPQGGRSGRRRPHRRRGKRGGGGAGS